jgi:hypothetical protein
MLAWLVYLLMLYERAVCGCAACIEWTGEAGKQGAGSRVRYI